jgi:hypothetical protein
MAGIAAAVRFLLLFALVPRSVWEPAKPLFRISRWAAGLRGSSGETNMTRSMIAASVMALILGTGPAFSQATPLLNPPPTQPGAAAKTDSQMSKHKTASKKKMKRSRHSSRMSQ